MKDEKTKRIKGRYRKVLIGKTRMHKPKKVRVLTLDIECKFVNRDHPKFENLLECIAVGVAVATYDNEGEALIWKWNVDRNFTLQELVEKVVYWLKENKLKIPRRELHFVSHYSIAENRHFTDWKQYESIQIGDRGMVLRARKSKKKGDQRIEVDGKKYRVDIHDSFLHFLSGLGDVGRYIGEEKVEIRAGGKGHSYWISRMDELKRSYPKKFWSYLEKDVIILLKAWTEWRSYFRREWDYEALGALTTPQIAGDIFRVRFLGAGSAAAQFREQEAVKSKEVKGEWKRQKIIREIYAGSKDKRYFAMRAYQGGRRGAFGQGVLVIDGIMLDFSGFYRRCAYLQSLPCETTEWKNLISPELSELKGKEGFALIDFSWRNATNYPMLGVMKEYSRRLIFPQTGNHIYCTVFEALVAASYGCEIEVHEAWFFTPGDREVNHPIREFLEYWGRRKAEARQDSMEYKTAKMMSNSLIGKFAQRVEEVGLKDLLDIYDRFGEDAAVQIISSMEIGMKKVGAYWAPEWSALILGRARAILGAAFIEAEKLGLRPIYGHTDSITLEYKPKEIMKLIHIMGKKYGVTLQPETDRRTGWTDGRFDKIWQERASVYVLWKGNISFHEAHHAYHIDRERKREIWIGLVENNLKQGRNVKHDTYKISIIRPKTAVKENVPLGAQYHNPTNITWKWDWKRRLDKPLNENEIFREWTWSNPWMNAWEAEQAENKVEHPGLYETRRRRKSGRPRKPFEELSQSGIRVRRWRERRQRYKL